MESKGMEQLYQKIANQLNLIIPELWDKVLLYSEVTEWRDKTFFYYYPHEKNTPVYSLDIEDMDNVDEDEINNQLRQLNEYLRELWNQFKDNNQEPWTNLTFELTSQGQFNIDYDYKNLDEEDAYEQQVIWEYEKLGLVPDKNRERDVKIIEEYKRSKN
ncbi:immunity protein YezG family protein [Fictibacillus sp. Mic-4]|uniref:immunity protein YezG family protein n=1 Tax=Fictibacillus sp. Mic-4 TaxID=3132826 RepID=UPI003CE921A7